jgi:hypothetical protein
VDCNQINYNLTIIIAEKLIRKAQPIIGPSTGWKNVVRSPTEAKNRTLATKISSCKYLIRQAFPHVTTPELLNKSY